MKYLRIVDQGTWAECETKKVRGISIHDDGVYKQMKITLKDGSHRFADNIHFADNSIFDVDIKKNKQ